MKNFEIKFGNKQGKGSDRKMGRTKQPSKIKGKQAAARTKGAAKQKRAAAVTR